VSRADWEQLKERVALYQGVVLERAKETSEATLNSYQSGVSDFPELVRARLAELDAELKLLRLKADRVKAQAQLLFLEGENDA
jgi:outer membrane protein TolC